MEDGEWRQIEVGREPQLLLILSSSDLFVRVLVKCGVGVGLPKATLRMADAVGRKSCGGREMLGRGRPGQPGGEGEDEGGEREIEKFFCIISRDEKYRSPNCPLTQRAKDSKAADGTAVLGGSRQWYIHRYIDSSFAPAKHPKSYLELSLLETNECDHSFPDIMSWMDRSPKVRKSARSAWPPAPARVHS